MLVYDVTQEKTFDNIRNWIRNIEEVKRITPIRLETEKWYCGVLVGMAMLRGGAKGCGVLCGSVEGCDFKMFVMVWFECVHVIVLSECGGKKC